MCLNTFCLFQVHSALIRAVDFFLQDLTGLRFPPADTVLYAYLHFEVLTEHEYKYSCGDYYPVVIVDLHKKGFFQFSGMCIVIRFSSQLLFTFSYDVLSLSKWSVLYYRY